MPRGRPGARYPVSLTVKLDPAVLRAIRRRADNDDRPVPAYVRRVLTELTREDVQAEASETAASRG